ncbi:conserved hypothetical protein [Flavobacterium sp. 9AF]|uniref:hypothetical protein n=1 Tax=Flavobacterium sp. 9AF TaxID=2653142 RepID=UPI0012EF2D49|nr:hypothetical protein [Flavobacterium sp. 9AF]VXB52228.1 conserved hypothetical protein [Flavobacterium sp. 9AF]
MKFTSVAILVYLMVLMALPSVRAIKLQLGNECEENCDASKQNECEKGNFIMSLSFSPLQIIKTLTFNLSISNTDFELKKESSFYESFFVSAFHNTIWNPPKF